MFTQVYLVLTVILLINLLIALMAKTFDIVHDNLSLNFKFLFARVVASAAAQSVVPPPLNLLGLPCRLIRRSPRLALPRWRIQHGADRHHWCTPARRRKPGKVWRDVSTAPK